MDLTGQVLARGTEVGLDAVGVARVEVFASTRALLHQRKAAGLHGGMNFTYRNPDRSTDPSRLLPGARSLVVGALSYLRRPPDRPPGPGEARVAAYQWDDHYGELARRLAAVGELLEEKGHRMRVVVDDNGLVDREAAVRAGIGFYGKNTMVLVPGAGSTFVLGSLVTDAELTPSAPVEAGCGPCTRCLPACPTGALVEPGVLDARRCLAWLVQATGTFPLEHRVALGDRLYGCDDCQDACPPVRRSARSVQLTVGRERTVVELVELLEADDANLLERFGHWYLPARDPDHLRRNALVVLGNVGKGTAAGVERVLRRHLVGPPLVAAHAVWAARRLGREDLVAELVSSDDPQVLAELAVSVPQR